MFIGDDSSFNLIKSIEALKSNPHIHEIDYPYVMGSGYVEVIPTETYSVRQYGITTNKVYKFQKNIYSYKRLQDKYIVGSYELKNSRVTSRIGRYETELEVFRITKDTYLLGSEVLIVEN